MNRLKTMLAATVAGIALLAQPIAASACTSVYIKAQDGGYIYGRTMEFGMPLNSQAIVVPRKIAMKGTGPDGKPGTGLHWTGKYGAVGLNGVGLSLIIDGMNEKGLVGGLLYLPNLAEFQDVSPEEAKNSIASYEMLTYVLTSFATVAEVKEALPKIKVNRSEQAAFKAAVPLHMTLHDATGASLVVEYIGGKLQMHDNPTGVLTNGPAFDWQLTNLGQWGNLQPTEPAPIQMGGATFASPSTGAGLHGLPGDTLSTSRFVRAFIFSRALPQPKTSEEGVALVAHVMNNFDIPPGSVVTQAGSAAGGGVAGFEITEWTAFSDAKNGRYYFSTHANPTKRVLDLNKVNLDAKAITLFPSDQPEAPIAIGQ